MLLLLLPRLLGCGGRDDLRLRRARLAACARNRWHAPQWRGPGTADNFSLFFIKVLAAAANGALITTRGAGPPRAPLVVRLLVGGGRDTNLLRLRKSLQGPIGTFTTCNWARSCNRDNKKARIAVY